MKLGFKCVFLAILFGLFGTAANAASNNSVFTSVPTAKNTQQGQTINLIKTYYNALNKKDMPQFYSVISNDIVHDINEGNTEKGMTKFKAFMDKAMPSFDDNLSNIIILVSDDGKYAAAHWVDHGIFRKDYPGMNLKASNQKYKLDGVQFFEIKKDKIARVSTFYNENEFMKQVQK